MFRWIACLVVACFAAGCASQPSRDNVLVGRLAVLQAIKQAQQSQRHDRIIELATGELERLNVDPEWRAVMYRTRGVSRFSRKEYAEAIADCSASIALNPTVYLTYVVRGYAYVARKQFNLSLVDFDKALELKPDDELVRVYRLGLRVRSGLLREALEDAEWLVAAKPNSGVVWYLRGLIHEKMGRRTAALADYRKALTLNSDLRAANEGIARIQSGGSGQSVPPPPLPDPEAPVIQL